MTVLLTLNSLQAAMIYFGIFLVLATSAFATELSDKESKENKDTSQKRSTALVAMSDICFHENPSLACTLKCRSQKQHPFCDKNQMCKCVSTDVHPTQISEGVVPTLASPLATSAKPSEAFDEQPMRCIMNIVPRPCFIQCRLHGLAARCKDTGLDQICMCFPKEDVSLGTTQQAPVTHKPSTPTGTVTQFCLFGLIPTNCVEKCKKIDQESYCDDKNICLCRKPKTEDVVDNDEAMCLAGVPSLTCYTNCLMTNQTAFCEEDKCHCKHNNEMRDDNTGSNIKVDTIDLTDDYDDEEDQKPGVMFYLFRWSHLFGDDASTTVAPPISVHVTDLSRPVYSERTEETWSTQYYLAVLIIILLSILVVFELISCFKKQKNKSKIESIFSTTPLSNKS